MNERTGAQLRVIKAVINVLGAVNIPAWLFGGWGLDARIGRITREHGDIEFWVERIHAERTHQRTPERRFLARDQALAPPASRRLRRPRPGGGWVRGLPDPGLRPARRRVRRDRLRRGAV